MGNSATASIVRRGKGQHEESHSHNYALDPFKPPLTVVGVGISHWGPGDSVTIASRGQTSLNLVTEGDAVFVQDEFSGVARPGDLVVLHAGKSQMIGTGPSGRLHKYFMLVDGPLMIPYVNASGLAGRHVVDCHRATGLGKAFEEAFGVMAGKQDGFAMAASLLAQRIFTEIAWAGTTPLPAPLGDAVSFINRNLNRSLDLSEIAASMNAGRRTCIRAFNRHLGMTPVKYHLRQRLQWAENLLATTNLQVKDIAAQVGYVDPLYFSAQFRQHAGKPPSTVRNSFNA